MVILLVILVLVLLFGGGWWGYSSRTYYGPGLLWIVAISILILWLLGVFK